VFRVVQRRTMSHTDMGIVGATTDTFILFENGVRRNGLVLPGLSTANTIEFTIGTAVCLTRTNLTNACQLKLTTTSWCLSPLPPLTGPKSRMMQ